MPPKRNYDFEKRRKEQDRKTKKDLKRAERQQRRDERRVDDAPSPAPNDFDPKGRSQNHPPQPPHGQHSSSATERDAAET